jgi:hypothetical protein
MATPAQSGIRTVYDHWWDAAATLLAYQWKLFEVQYQVGLKMMQAAFGAEKGPEAGKREATPGPPPGTPSTSGGSPTAGKLQQLERLAAERVSQGLPPPREVYQAPYRNQIDWTRFPEWARPSDPELFEGTGHEG